MHRLPPPPCPHCLRRSADWPRPTWPPNSPNRSPWPPRRRRRAGAGRRCRPDRLSADRPDPALPAAVAARRRVADRMQRRLLMSAAECAPSACCACWRCSGPADPAAAGRAGLPGRSRHRRLQRGRPALVPRLVPRPIGRRQPLAGTGAQRRLRPVRPPARWSALGASAAHALATALSLLPPCCWRPAADAPAATATPPHPDAS